MELIPREWLDRAVTDGYMDLIPYESFTRIKEIDYRGFAPIRFAAWAEKRRVAALKKLERGAKDPMLDDNDYAEFTKELLSLIEIGESDYIVQFSGVTKETSTDTYMLVMPYATNGPLHKYLDRMQQLTWRDKIQLAHDVALSLHFLHSRDILHRNLHSGNVLVNSEGKPVLSDFGLKRPREFLASPDYAVGRVPYIAPERLKSRSSPYDKPCDVYSLGVILWEISSAHRPFNDTELQPMTLAFQITNGDREQTIEGTPPPYADLYRQCWHQDASARPSIDDIVSRLRSMLVASREDIDEEEQLITRPLEEDTTDEKDTHPTEDEIIRVDLPALHPVITTDDSLSPQEFAFRSLNSRLPLGQPPVYQAIEHIYGNEYVAFDLLRRIELSTLEAYDILFDLKSDMQLDTCVQEMRISLERFMNNIPLPSRTWEYSETLMKKAEVLSVFVRRLRMLEKEIKDLNNVLCRSRLRKFFGYLIGVSYSKLVVRHIRRTTGFAHAWLHASLDRHIADIPSHYEDLIQFINANTLQVPREHRPPDRRRTQGSFDGGTTLRRRGLIFK